MKKCLALISVMILWTAGMYLMDKEISYDIWDDESIHED